jgi:hypothetical protein
VEGTFGRMHERAPENAQSAITEQTDGLYALALRNARSAMVRASRPKRRRCGGSSTPAHMHFELIMLQPRKTNPDECQPLVLTMWDDTR